MNILKLKNISRRQNKNDDFQPDCVALKMILWDFRMWYAIMISTKKNDTLIPKNIILFMFLYVIANASFHMRIV